MLVRKLSETATTVTLGWDTVAGAVGFRFIVDGKVSHTFDGTRTSVRVHKAASRVSVEALAAKDSGVWTPVATPPPTGCGAKLPPFPVVHETPPSRVLAATDFPTVDAGAAGTYRAITGVEDATVKFPAGTQTAWPNIDNCGRVVVDMTGVKLPNLHFGMKISNVEDFIVKGWPDVSGCRVQAVMGTNSARRVWLLVNARDNQPDPVYVGPQNAHGFYLGSAGRWEHVTVFGRISRQRGGYGVQAYDDYGVSGAGLYDAVFLLTLEGLVGDPQWDGNGTGVLIAHGGNVRVANTLARGNARQIAGRWASAGPLALVSSADVARTGPDTDWFLPPTGTAGSDPNIPGDPGYRHPYDTRTTGIGAP